ncbi:MAG: type II toxin-antitoxin system RelE/ParE family toxin [Lachnoclostridium edouardi]|uniref:type II toxin-antitoxin system RelE/ParE family toxin n=1 Tax=Lachnoclostridium edouardi TaxID=1926283 RepID=UPI0026DB01D5|nr:type II toxin-antitoxin system RelE/ParE family toxin [Lachnoclostridium edouardi]MDO4277318.1 type II toxin-antitoxin system RelE/ParE family toxin [Lachnoclostridium edouardi]
MREYKVVLTWEAIYDVIDITEYIEEEFGKERADKFQADIQREMEKLEYIGGAFLQTQLLYRKYAIHKKPFPPSVIFYVSIEKEAEIHVLRVLREEQDWERILGQKKTYTYLDR